MATIRWYWCPKCKPAKPISPRLFDALMKLTKREECRCPSCKDNLQLRLKFPFALGAKGKEVTALASFLPDPLLEWDNNGQRVIFYPFMVITEGEFGKSVWLPYFHVVGDEKRRLKYGERAPYIGIGHFESLLKQARLAGYLEG